MLGIYAHTCAPYEVTGTNGAERGTVHIYLTFITEQIWLPHSKCCSHGQYAMWVHQPNIFAHISKHNQLNNMDKLQMAVLSIKAPGARPIRLLVESYDKEEACRFGGLNG